LLKGEIGKRLRKQILENYHYMKTNLNNRGFEILGNPSPICPVLLRNEMISRIVCRLMMDEGVHCNTIEFPVVKLGQARLRVNL
jgi:glycine C-acetyltransferase